MACVLRGHGHAHRPVELPDVRRGRGRGGVLPAGSHRTQPRTVEGDARASGHRAGHGGAPADLPDDALPDGTQIWISDVKSFFDALPVPDDQHPILPLIQDDARRRTDTDAYIHTIYRLPGFVRSTTHEASTVKHLALNVYQWQWDRQDGLLVHRLGPVMQVLRSEGLVHRFWFYRFDAQAAACLPWCSTCWRPPKMEVRARLGARLDGDPGGPAVRGGAEPGGAGAATRGVPRQAALRHRRGAGLRAEQLVQARRASVRERPAVDGRHHARARRPATDFRPGAVDHRAAPEGGRDRRGGALDRRRGPRAPPRGRTDRRVLALPCSRRSSPGWASGWSATRHGSSPALPALVGESNRLGFSCVWQRG